MNILHRLATPAILVCIVANAHAFSITAGTLIGVDGNSNRLVEYSTGGTINEILSLSGSFSTPVGVEVVGSSVYVMGVNGDVNQVNLATGAMSLLFNGGGNEGLGTRGNNLLVLNYLSGEVLEFTVGGVLLNTYAIGTGGTGVDGAAAGGFAVAHFSDGNVYTYNASGGLVSSFSTGLNGSEISGLAYDAGTNSYWVSSGFGSDDIRHFSSTGTLLGSFAANSGWINGLDYVSGPQNVPDSGSSLLVLAVAMTGMVALRRRKS
jgi:uncharacterized protein YjiK